MNVEKYRRQCSLAQPRLSRFAAMGESDEANVHVSLLLIIARARGQPVATEGDLHLARVDERVVGGFVVRCLRPPPSPGRHTAATTIASAATRADLRRSGARGSNPPLSRPTSSVCGDPGARDLTSRRGSSFPA